MMWKIFGMGVGGLLCLGLALWMLTRDKPNVGSTPETEVPAASGLTPVAPVPEMPPTVYTGEVFELAGVTIGQAFKEAQAALQPGATAVENNGMPPTMYGEIYIRPEGRVHIYSNLSEGGGGPESRYVSTIVVERTAPSLGVNSVQSLNAQYRTSLARQLGRGDTETRTLGPIRIRETTWQKSNVTITLTYEEEDGKPFSAKVKAEAS